jgi:hypothetical protein
MTQSTTAETYPIELAVPPQPANASGKQISIDEIIETFQAVTEDIAQIGKLNTEEKTLVSNFLSMLQKNMQQITPSIAVSVSVLPFRAGSVTQANIYPNGQLEVHFETENVEFIDLREPRNRDLMMVVIDDVMPKFEALALEFAAQKLRKPPVEEPPHIKVPASEPPALAIQEPLPVPEPLSLPEVAAEPPVSLPTPEPEPAPTEEVPEELPKIAEPHGPDLMAQRNAQIETVAAETLNWLDMLGGEVFEQEPVSKYFDDWMVNLRQIMLSFESNEVIGADEAFNVQCNQIFGQIQDELDNRIANEADIAVSYRTLVENRYLLNKIDEEHAAQTKQLVEKGTSAIETLMRSMANIERELAEVQAVKVSYRHPMQKMAKDQKITELTQKLNSVKKRLAMAVGTSSVDGGKSGDIEAQFEAQTKMLEEKRKVAMDLLNKNVDDLANEISKLKMTKTSNPIKKVAIQQQVFETEQKFVDAKKRLQLAEQNSSYEMEQLRAEFEKKKQAALGKMQTLEKDIATKTVDNSAEVRKQAAKALAEAVKSLAQKKTATPLNNPENSVPEVAEGTV